MRKIICFLLALTTLIFSSCTIVPKEHKQTPDEAAKELQTQIMECFVNKDKDTLKSFFCEYVSNSSSLDSQINTAFDFLDGEIVSYSDATSGGVTGSSERKSYGGETKRIITDKGTEYSIGFKGWFTNDKEPDKVGVLLIGVHNETLLNEADSKEDIEKCNVYIGKDD